MKLLFIYGPPAAGKLTVAREVERLTSFSIFQNNLAADLAKVLFKFGTPQFYDLCTQIRLCCFEAAARERLQGVVFPFCYSHPEDEPFIARAEELLFPHGAEALYVHLTPSRQELERRIVNESRRAMGKISTIQGLRAFLAQWNFIKIPGRESLEIDNSELSATETAAKIVEHFKLDLVG